MHTTLTILVTGGASLGQCPTYSVQLVDGINCGIIGQSGAIGWGLAENGAVCGWFDTCNADERAFYWPPGGSLTPIIFPIPFGPFGGARAHDVNASGAIVGRISSPSLPGRRAFKHYNGNTVFLSPVRDDVMSEALAVNIAGNVVGTSTGLAVLRAAFWEGDALVSLQLPFGPNSTAFDINDSNQICGWMGEAPVFDFPAHAFIWHNGLTDDLDVPGGATATVAQAINNLGDTCGFFNQPDGGKAGFIRRPCAWIDGQFVDLGTLPGLVGGLALDINDAGEIVGYCTEETGVAIAPFLWRDGVMHDINDLVPAGSPPLTIARAINNRGQIAGEGVGPDDSIAFLVTPSLPAHAGDTDCDSAVNINDLLNVINRWNPTGPVGGEPADLNRDNKIDHADLLEVIFNWGQ